MVQTPVTGAGAGSVATEQAALHVSAHAKSALCNKAHLSDHPIGHPIGCGKRIPLVSAAHLLAISKLRPSGL